MGSISDEAVVVTGASSGIGRATALEFARRGARLVLAARRESALEALVRDCETLGGQAIAVPTDVADEAQVTELARRAVEAFGRIDVWVNNAGVIAYGPFEELPADVFRRVVETNLFGYVHGARAAIRRFREQGEGVLINNASILGTAGAPYQSAYVASKYGIVGLGESIRQEVLEEDRIHVRTILPASVDTPLFRHAANYMGRSPRPPEPVFDARRVATAIVGAAERPSKKVFVPAPGALAALARRLAPEIFDRLATDGIRRRNFSSLPAAPGPGNLFEPVTEDGGIDGGWRADDRSGAAPSVRRRFLPAAVLVAAAVLTAALASRVVSDEGSRPRVRIRDSRR